MSFVTQLDQDTVDKMAEELSSTILTDEVLCSVTDDPIKNREALFDNCAYVRVVRELSWNLYLTADIYPETLPEMLANIKADVARVKEAAGISAA
jgi:hypothetical protein